MFILYTKNDCVYCDIMKAKLKEWKTPYSLVNISVNDIGLKWLKDNGYKTVPQLFYNGHSLNNGIDTNEFTLEMLLDNVNKLPFNISDDVLDWADKVIEKINESKSV